jgi:GNAT superfamily N-acetyltransferase
MPSPSCLGIRQADLTDLDAVVRLLHGAYDWLVARGITDQWADRFPRSGVRDRIERGEVYVAFDQDRPIGTFTLDFRPDPELWDEPPDEAGYVHRLVVAREYAGRDLGGWLLDCAGQLVAATGREWLRLDCAKHNSGLHDYYRRHGFAHLRTVDLPHRQSGALFERRAAPGSSRSMVTGHDHASAPTP